MSATPERREQRRDPLEEERGRARQASEGGGELPADRDETDDVAAHPSLGSPPRRDRSRPVFRSSQLDGEDEAEQGRPLRG